jgi:hypothetical protein
MIEHCVDYSTELSKPVAWNFVSFEHLLSKFLIASIFHSVYLESVGISVDVMVFGEEITHWIKGCNTSHNHQANYFSIRNLTSGQEHQIF